MEVLTFELAQRIKAHLIKTNQDHDKHYYGSLSHVESDDELLEDMEVITDYLEQNMPHEYVNKLHLLRELERELTLRESR